MTAPALQPDQPPPLRWWRYVRARRIHCPAGHHIPHTFHVRESGAVRCQHRTKGIDCGRWVFLLPFRGGSVITAEVTLAELAEMEDLQTPTEVLDFLGIFG